MVFSTQKCTTFQNDLLVNRLLSHQEERKTLKNDQFPLSGRCVYPIWVIIGALSSHRPGLFTKQLSTSI